MIYGLYLSTSGSLTQMAREEQIANNLANLTTDGFKKDVILFKQIPTQVKRKGIFPYYWYSDPIQEKMGGTVMIYKTFPIYTQGGFKNTDNPLDVAIDGKGFFVLSREDKIYYTRNGAFKIDAEGYLVNASGEYRVLDENGSFISVKGTNIYINSKGEVIVDGEKVSQLKVVDFDNYKKLEKHGDNMYVNVGKAKETTFKGTLRPGFLETSNVNPVEEMVRMIEAFRAYEANMRSISNQDSTLGRVVNDVPRIQG